MSSKITGRDYEILRHLLRYKVATREMFHRALFAKVSHNAVTKVLTRLVAKDWLNRHPFLAASCYFTLTEKAAQLFGTPEAAIEQPIPPRQMVAEYAVAAYCCLGEKPRQLLTTDEIAEDYPELVFDQPDSGRYYLDSGFRPEFLGQIIVDDGAAPAGVPGTLPAKHRSAGQAGGSPQTDRRRPLSSDNSYSCRRKGLGVPLRIEETFVAGGASYGSRRGPESDQRRGRSWRYEHGGRCAAAIAAGICRPAERRGQSRASTAPKRRSAG